MHEVPHSRLVWSNDEADDGGAVTTVTFEEKDGKTLLVMHDRYRSKEALDVALAGMEGGMRETCPDQLDELVDGLFDHKPEVANNRSREAVAPPLVEI